MTMLSLSEESSLRSSHDGNSSGGLRILVGVNDPAIRCWLTYILRADGHDVCEAADGATMLEGMVSGFTAHSRPFDVIIAEERAPVMPGLFILAGMRSSGRTTPFILVTDEARVETAARRIGAIVLAPPPASELCRAAINQSQTNSASQQRARHR